MKKRLSREERKLNRKTRTSIDFDVEMDPDYPVDAIQSNVIVEEIEMNGKR
jgi:hypothetical protein